MEDTLMGRIDQLSDKCDTLQRDVDAMNDICSDMKEENELLQEKINKLEVAENQSRLSNLLFFGIPSTASELWADCENKDLMVSLMK
ncbi:hypothetical protein ACOMHN_000570 [Nucella lapillus]